MSLPGDSLHSYDGAKMPSLQPKEQHSNTEPNNTEDNWMPLPLASNCPPGLEYLTEIDRFFVGTSHDHPARKNTFLIKNASAQKVYTAVEDYDKCCKICCNTTRPFDIRVFDFNKREVLHFHRPLGCQSCWCPCCLQHVEVTASGTLCGYIKQSWSLRKPKFRICDATGKTVLLIEGPSNHYVLTKFKVLSSDGATEVGRVSALLTSLVHEHLFNAGHFSISFPMDLGAKIKAVLLAASILIDCLYYKRTLRTNSNNSSSQLFATSAGFEVGSCLANCLF